MMIIVFTVVTQSWTVPEEDKGELTTPMLTVNSGVFQAIGVISFGMLLHLIYRSRFLFLKHRLMLYDNSFSSLCLP